MPLLFQWHTGGQNRGVSQGHIRKALNETLEAAGITDAAGQPLDYQPHDFRRIFVTDAIANGLPPAHRHDHLWPIRIFPPQWATRRSILPRRSRPIGGLYRTATSASPERGISNPNP